MALAAFDTLEFVKILEKSGIPALQAEAISTAVHKTHESSEVATKQDIADLRKDLAAVEERTDAKLEKLEIGLRYEISDLRKDMDANCESLRKDMIAMEQRFNTKLDKLGLQIINRLGGLIVAGVAVIAALPVISKLLHLS